MPVFDDLKAKLQELFMFDRADLDFGMYRILNAKRAEVTRFLETELLPSARAALGSVTAEDQARLKAAVETAREQARKFGAPDPDATPGVQEAKAAYRAAADTGALEEEIYSHLLTFFSRYYQEGDFIPQRRYSAAGRERYMIPYDGEEVKLVWANMEQYYIKSGESLTDYAFTFADPAGGTRPFRVEFRLVTATEETANNKSQTGERRFALADLAAHPPALSGDGTTLTLAFTYVEHPKGTKQTELLEAAEAALAKAGLPAPFAAQLAAADSSYTGKSARTVLRKHLEIYAAKNTYDYFIHKDLGGFLRRELDYFIKTEVLRLDDLLPEDPVAARRQLQKVHALKTLAGQIIDFLEQIENFQKKLWLKKKFVTEVRYCLTLDRIPESFYPEIAANVGQREEWKSLYHIQAIEADGAGQLGYPGDKKPLTVEFLKANHFLVLDTKHFSEEFSSRLVSAIAKLHDSIDGTCFHSENFQALSFMEGTYGSSIKCVITDPPYNTGSDGFPYKDGFMDASWLSMMQSRMKLARELLAPSGLLFVNIDSNEGNNLEYLLDSTFGQKNRIEELIWAQNTTHSGSPTYSSNHEYVQVYAKSRESAEAEPGMFREEKPGYKELNEIVLRLNPDYPHPKEVERAIGAAFETHLTAFMSELAELGLSYNEETKKQDPWRGIYPYSNVEYRTEKGEYVDPGDARRMGARLSIWRESDPSMPAGKQSETTKDPKHPNYRFYAPKHPLTDIACEVPKRGWGFPEKDFDDRVSFESLAANKRIVFGQDHTTIPQYKRFLDEVDTNVAKTVIHDYTDGEKELFGLTGTTNSFPNPKPTTLARRFIRQANTSESTILDFFGGSGTTATAVIYLNREEKLRRKFVTVEMAEYFESTLVPRIKKGIYSSGWDGGKPTDRRSGLSFAFKIVKLENYEDTLNNLRLPTRTADQTLALEGSTPEARANYLLRYSLELETQGSAALLDLKKFSAPWSYQLSIHRNGETRPVTVDLVETFNWLLGLRVEQQDAPVTLTADFETDPAGRTIVKKGSLRKAASGWTFQAVTGRDRTDRLHLVLWRSLTGDAVKDNAVLDAFFQKQGYNARDTEFDTIYVNGDNNLANLALAADTPEAPSAYKVKLIETEFHRLMWDVRDV